MKKNALTNAVIASIAGVAGIASVANAVNLNPDGLGEVLVYPYYTVNGGNTTLVSVVNTTGAGKAVKVRFVEGKNSREVLDFNLYLSPYDVWTGSIFAIDATGPAHLLTTDNSCTARWSRTTRPVWLWAAPALSLSVTSNTCWATTTAPTMTWVVPVKAIWK
ncbi:MAG: hypothetical protein IPK97_07490 [Ahniella sp.]|nr:hypothetical protein [Ahniella sp.]